MKNTPVTVVDDFFDYPDPIREWGLRDDIKYEPSDDGSWPGKRHMLTHTEFGNKFASQVGNLLYDFNEQEYALDYTLSFQRVKKSSHSPDSPMHQGWIHTDPTVYSAILYLNKDFPATAGTTIFDPLPGKDISNQDMKHEYYLGKDIDEEKYIKAIEENNKNFTPSVRIANKYNRLLLFEGYNYHGVESFYTDSDEDRLTLAFFAFQIKTSSKSPIMRLSQRY